MFNVCTNAEKCVQQFMSGKTAQSELFFFFQTCNAMPVILFEPFQKGGVWEECQDSQFYWTCALTY